MRITCHLLQLIPLFVMDVLGDYYGIPGLFTATVFAATLRYGACKLVM